MSPTIVTEMEDVATRLAPTPTSVETPVVAWPFVPKERMQVQNKTSKRLPINRKAMLLRSSSFVKLRNFCNNSCDAFPNALLYLQSSSTALQQSLNEAKIQLKEVMLVLAVYSCIALLLVQVIFCGYALVGKAAPLGLIFMITSILVIMGIYVQMISNSTNRQSRQRQPRRIILQTLVLKKLK